MSVFDVFLYANDYHNLKRLPSKKSVPIPCIPVFDGKGQCTIDPLLIQKAIREHDYQLLPEHMQAVAKSAADTLLHTGDGQLCDIIIDRAALTTIYESGRKSGNEILDLYGELTVAFADIKTAIRACRTGKDIHFLTRALAP